MDPISTTGLYTAMLRARESARPDRLFSDPFAEVLAGPQGNDVLALLEASSSAGSPNPVIPIRTRFFDDALERILGELGVDQLVILAAGMDTRAFRLPLPPDLALYELDRTEVLDLKAARLAQTDAVPCCRRIPLPVDLTGEWSTTLQGGGFDRQRPSAWLVEGLTPYLTDDQVHHMLVTLSELAVAGSWLLADVIGHSLLTSSRLAGFRATMAANGSPFRFGTDDPEGLLGADATISAGVVAQRRQERPEIGGTARRRGVYLAQVELGVSAHNQIAEPGGATQPLSQLAGYQAGTGEHAEGIGIGRRATQPEPHTARHGEIDHHLHGLPEVQHDCVGLGAQWMEVPGLAWQVLDDPAQMALHRRRTLGEQLAVDRDAHPSAASTSSCALRMTVSVSHQN